MNRVLSENQSRAYTIPCRPCKSPPSCPRYTVLTARSRRRHMILVALPARGRRSEQSKGRVRIRPKVSKRIGYQQGDQSLSCPGQSEDWKIHMAWQTCLPCQQSGSRCEQLLCSALFRNINAHFKNQTALSRSVQKRFSSRRNRDRRRNHPPRRGRA